MNHLSQRNYRLIKWLICLLIVLVVGYGWWLGGWSIHRLSDVLVTILADFAVIFASRME